MFVSPNLQCCLLYEVGTQEQEKEPSVPAGFRVISNPNRSLGVSGGFHIRDCNIVPGIYFATP